MVDEGEALRGGDRVKLEGRVGEGVGQSDVALASLIEPRHATVLHCLGEGRAVQSRGHLDHAAHIEGGVGSPEDVLLDEVADKESDHGTHIHNHQKLGEVRRAAGGTYFIRHETLEEDNYELYELHGGDIVRPGTFNAQSGEEIVEIDCHVVERVKKNRKIHVSIVVKGKDEAHDDGD